MKLYVQRWWSVVITAFIVFLAFGSSDGGSSSSSSASSYDSSSSSSSSSSGSSGSHDLGYEGVIDVGGGIIPIARTEEAFGELTNIMLAKDKEGIAKMMLEGKVFSVDNGTKARLIGRNWTGGIRIRILSGESYGEDGWMAKEFLR